MSLFQSFLNELALCLEFRTLHPDEHGACLIEIKEGKIPLLFELDERLVPQTVLISTPLFSIPSKGRLQVLEASLKGNKNQEEILSYLAEEEMIYLHRRFHPEVKAEQLKIYLTTFLDQVHAWKNKLTQIAEETPQYTLKSSHFFTEQ